MQLRKRRLLLRSQGSGLKMVSIGIKVELANRELYFLELREDSLLDLQRVKSQSVSEESLKNAPVPTIIYENSVHCVLFIVDVE
ncbi:unnamed protein product [Brassica oleracea]